MASVPIALGRGRFFGERVGMVQGEREAAAFLEHSSGLREALGIASDTRLSAVPLAQGEHNANFWFRHPGTGKKIVLRLNYASQLGLEDQASYEYEALSILAPSGRTPRPLYLDDSKGIVGRGVVAMEFCEGDRLNYLRGGDVPQAAATLADIHAVRPPEGCRLLQPSDPLEEQFLECVGLFEIYRGWAHADARVVDAVEDLLARARGALDAVEGARDRVHVLNTEAVAEHFIIPHDGFGAVARMVDWEKPILGEVAQDVAYFLSPTTTIWKVDFIFDDDARTAFVEEYWKQVGGRFPRAGFDGRFSAYVMTNCLRGITWSAAATVEYQDPDRPLRNADTAKRLGLYLAPEFLEQVRSRFFS